MVCSAAVSRSTCCRSSVYGGNRRTTCGSPLVPWLKRLARDRLRCELIELYGLTEGIITTLAPEDFDRSIALVFGLR